MAMQFQEGDECQVTSPDLSSPQQMIDGYHTGMDRLSEGEEAL